MKNFKRFCIPALEEYRDVAESDMAYATLIACCMCIALHVITIYASFYDELVRSASGLLQCTIPVTTMSITGMVSKYDSVFIEVSIIYES